MGTRRAEQRDRRVGHGRAEVKDKPATGDALRDADRNRQLADAIECQSGSEGIGFERDAGACDCRRALSHKRSREHEESQRPARARHGRRKMIRRTPDAWRTLEMPWLSGVGLLATVVIPVWTTSPIVAETSSVPCCSAPSDAGWRTTGGAA